jgi:hypothetical protein
MAPPGGGSIGRVPDLPPLLTKADARQGDQNRAIPRFGPNPAGTTHALDGIEG